MTNFGLVTVLEIAEPALCAIAIATMIRARAVKEYGFLIALLATRVAAWSIGWSWITVGHRFVTETTLYVCYFYFYWTAFAIESALMLVVVCCMYRLAMAPLRGLHHLGMIVFKWAAAISVLVAMGAAFAPHMTKLTYLIAFVTEMQRSQSILILSLLVFVCFAIRPMGLSYRSRIFGVSLGLGVLATTSMIQATWIAQAHHMYGPFTMINSLATCLTVATWTAYFAAREPKRRLITLPTTSPFLRWNQISEVLGNNPGHVAIGGLPPEMLAPAEIEIMRRASLKMKSTLAAKTQIVDAA